MTDDSRPPGTLDDTNAVDAVARETAESLRAALARALGADEAASHGLVPHWLDPARRNRDILDLSRALIRPEE